MRDKTLEIIFLFCVWATSYYKLRVNVAVVIGSEPAYKNIRLKQMGSRNEVFEHRFGNFDVITLLLPNQSRTTCKLCFLLIVKTVINSNIVTTKFLFYFVNVWLQSLWKIEYFFTNIYRFECLNVSFYNRKLSTDTSCLKRGGNSRYIVSGTLSLQRYTKSDQIICSCEKQNTPNRPPET